ncbi:hypothetical protein Bca4012_020583 [Brassica carinata]
MFINTKKTKLTLAYPQAIVPFSLSGGAEIGQGHGLAEKDNGDEDEEDEDEDLSLRFAPARHAPSSVSSTGSNNINRDSKPPAVSFALRNRSPSSALGRNFVEQVPSVRSASAGRPSISARSTAPTPNLMPPSTVKAPKAIPPLDPPTRSRDKRFFADLPSVN